MPLTPFEQRRLDAINARKAAHRERAKRLARDLAPLARPTIDVYDGNPPDPTKEIEIIDRDTEGLLTYAFMKQGKDLDLKIDEWSSRPPPGSAFVDELKIEVADTPIGPWRPFQPQDIPADQQFPLIQPLAIEWLLGEANKQLYLRYAVEGWSGGNNVSELIPLRADTLAPWYNGVPREMTGGPSEPITDAWLTQNADKLELQIPVHPDEAPGDQLVICWARELPTQPGHGPHVVAIQPITAGYTATISGDKIRSVGSGALKAFYVVIDRAGNISRISEVKTLVVALGQLPENLKPPRVTAYDDNLIDRDDAWPSSVLAVLIDEYDNHAAGDTIRATWAGVPLAPFTLGTSYSFPLSLPVPWAALKAGYDFSDPTPIQTALVEYEVEQLLVPIEEGTGLQVNVDLSLPGPDNPDEPSPVNPTLPPPEVLAEGETDRNKLEEKHFEKDATLFLTLYASPTVGQTVTFFWNGLPGPSYDIQAGDVEGQEINVRLPWDLIRRGGNNAALPLHYELSQTGQSNSQRSPATDVDVQAVQVILPMAEFLRVHPTTQLLTCVSLVKHPAKDSYGVEVRIAPNEHLLAGRTVELKWEALTGTSGGAPIASATKEATLTVTEADQANGLTWLIEPYEDHILPTYIDDDSQIGRARLNYSLLIDGQTVGAPMAEKYVAMVQPGGTCSIPPPTAVAEVR
ncbi:hypothetical protein [Pseudomonas sp. nanlin1]|uniref:hypothetical protein n=1 Tax=Pseudomonas sp. nanlin1 TaxID=3040605 RepID=UPI00388D3055